MITTSVQADLETLHQYLAAIRERQPLKAGRPENDQELDAIKRDLTCIVGLVRRIGIAVATSLHGVLSANREDCFVILATEGVITTHLADVLHTAVRSWELFATALEDINATVTSHFCRCFLKDFDAYAQAVQLYQSGDSEAPPAARAIASRATPSVRKRPKCSAR